jgi:hypothetical protein
MLEDWGFHGRDYEEFHLLGYKTPVHTSQETLIRYIPKPVNTMQDFWFPWRWLWRMPSSVVWHRVSHVTTDVSEEHIPSIIKVTRIGELGTTLAAALASYSWRCSWIPHSCHLVMEAIRSSETSVLNKSHTVSHHRRLHSSLCLSLLNH